MDAYDGYICVTLCAAHSSAADDVARVERTATCTLVSVTAYYPQLPLTGGPPRPWLLHLPHTPPPHLPVDCILRQPATHPLTSSTTLLVLFTVPITALLPTPSYPDSPFADSNRILPGWVVPLLLFFVALPLVLPASTHYLWTLYMPGISSSPSVDPCLDHSTIMYGNILHIA